MNSTANMKEGTEGQTFGRLKWIGTVVFSKTCYEQKDLFHSAPFTCDSDR